MNKKSDVVKCRMIRAGDVKEVFELYEEAFFYAEKTDVQERVRGRKRKALVAEKNGEIVGFILFEFETHLGKKQMYVGNVGVKAENRSQGVCTVMVNWLMKKLKGYGCHRAFLHVSASNSHALSCYKRAGFKNNKDGTMRCNLPTEEGSPKPKPRKRKAA